MKNLMRWISITWPVLLVGGGLALLGVALLFIGLFGGNWLIALIGLVLAGFAVYWTDEGLSPRGE